MKNINITNYIEKYYYSTENKEYGRYLSWEHCYKAFYNEWYNQNKNYDYLALHLAFYLASWGMYRGSSFLLKKDYKIHIDAVKVLFKDKYSIFLGIKCKDLNENKITKLIELKKELEDCYKKYNNDRTITDTLSSKILLGTLGCIPAYDRYFKIGASNFKINQTFNKESIEGICNFYSEYNNELEKIRKRLKIDNKISYPQMKLIDMGFWQIGTNS